MADKVVAAINRIQHDQGDRVAHHGPDEHSAIGPHGRHNLVDLFGAQWVDSTT